MFPRIEELETELEVDDHQGRRGAGLPAITGGRHQRPPGTPPGDLSELCHPAVDVPTLAVLRFDGERGP